MNTKSIPVILLVASLLATSLWARADDFRVANPFQEMPEKAEQDAKRVKLITGMEDGYYQPSVAQCSGPSAVGLSLHDETISANKRDATILAVRENGRHYEVDLVWIERAVGVDGIASPDIEDGIPETVKIHVLGPESFDYIDSGGEAQNMVRCR